MNTTKTTTTTRTTNNQNRSQQQPKAITRQSLPGSNLTYIRGGNALETEKQTLVCAMNAQGRAPFGMAREIAKKFPKVFGSYQYKVQEGAFRSGSVSLMSVSETQKILLGGVWNMQEFAPREEWIALVLEKIGLLIQQGKITSLAITKIGCGGPIGLNWEDMGQILASYLGMYLIPVEIYIGQDDLAYFLTKNEDDDIVVTAIKPNEFIDDTDSIDL